MKDILKWIVYGGIFAVPLLTVVVTENLFFPFITGKNFSFRVIVEVMVAAWVLLALLDATYRPRFSWIVTGFGSLIVVMLFSTLLAQHWPTSLWSNYERMDGYVTLVHVFAYVVVAGSVLRGPTMWSYLLHWSVAVAAFVALKGLAQLGTGVTRVDSTLGNAAYMAVYMLFHVFFVAYLFMQSKVTPYRVVYALLGALFIYVLLQTGTRGTAIGLVTGAIAMVSYISLFAVQSKGYQKYAIASLAFLLLAVGGFIAARDTSFIQGTPSLARVANIDLGADLEIRRIIWGMSIEGVKERPLLGWGMGNFNYVFNEQYDPRLYAQEQWFDRVHNIFFDWLIAGGVLGFVAYFSIFAAAIYYLFVLPFWYKDEHFTVLERGVLIGLLVGYLTHNLVVFDNIISYIFFAVVLALIHSRVATPVQAIEGYKIDQAMVAQFVAPIVVIVAGFGIYFVNAPAYLAAKDIILAMRAQSWDIRLEYFEQALDRGSFARQEIVEQLAQNAIAAVQTQDVPDATKAGFTTLTESELQAFLASKPGDARIHVFAASYYRAIGQNDLAKEQFALAREFSPNKQSIILQQGAVEFNDGNLEAARDFFREAFELDERNDEARQFLMAAYLYTGETEEGIALYESGSDAFKAIASRNDFVVSAVNSVEEYELLAELYEQRVAIVTDVPQNWASLAFVYYQLDELEQAVATLERAQEAVPAFASTANCFIDNIEGGRAPQEGCR